MEFKLLGGDCIKVGFICSEEGYISNGINICERCIICGRTYKTGIYLIDANELSCEYVRWIDSLTRINDITGLERVTVVGVKDCIGSIPPKTYEIGGILSYKVNSYKFVGRVGDRVIKLPYVNFIKSPFIVGGEFSGDRGFEIVCPCVYVGFLDSNGNLSKEHVICSIVINRNEIRIEVLRDIKGVINNLIGCMDKYSRRDYVFGSKNIMRRK